MKSILITGSNGFLYPYLHKNLKQNYNITSSSRNESDYNCDLIHQEQVKKMIDNVNPDIIIHAAALTDIEKCESFPDKAFSINFQGTKNLAESINNKTKLIFISSDQVYSNDITTNEEKNPNPINIYGKSKLLGEQSLSILNNSLILRTNFFGRSLNNKKHSLYDFIVESLKYKRNVTFFSDICFSPVHMNTLCYYINDLIVKNISGIYNIGSRDGFSKAKFAEYIALKENLEFDKSLIGTSDLIENRVKRHKDLRMNVSKIENVLGYSMPTLEKEILNS